MAWKGKSCALFHLLAIMVTPEPDDFLECPTGKDGMKEFLLQFFTFEISDKAGRGGIYASIDGGGQPRISSYLLPLISGRLPVTVLSRSPVKKPNAKGVRWRVGPCKSDDLRWERFPGFHSALMFMQFLFQVSNFWAFSPVIWTFSASGFRLFLPSLLLSLS
jgi:hypothetical protein